MLKTLCLFVAIIAVGSCGQKIKSFKKETTVVETNFFPVTQYLLGQIKELDSLPVTPLKITTINGKTDSLWVRREDIRPFVQPFILPVIDSINYHRYFSEKSFLDQTINSFTFSYDPTGRLPDSMEIKRWDIYVDPGSHKVNRVYIVKQLNRDTPQTVQLIWKPGYYCQITTITEKTGAPAVVEERKLIWNF